MCDYCIDFKNGKEIQGIDAALRNYDQVFDAIKVADNIALSLPDVELSKKIQALLYVVSDKLGHADIAGGYGKNPKKVKLYIRCVREAFKRASPMSNNLNMLVGELVVFLAEFLHKQKNIRRQENQINNFDTNNQNLKVNPFSFSEGQAFYCGRDLDLPCGNPVDILKKLVESMGICVKHKDLDLQSSNSVALPALRGNILKIRKAIKAKKFPYKIKTNRGVGFTLLPSGK
jgi:hypothetical protein